MISEPYEDITKACEDAEWNAARTNLDYAVVMKRELAPAENRYHIVAVCNLDTLRNWFYQLIAIAKPIGLVYTWKSVPGYESNDSTPVNPRIE